MVALAAEQDWRIRLLLGFGIEPDRVESDKFAVEFRLILGPQGLHGEHAFAQYLETAAVVGAMIFHLLGIPAPANAKDETTPGESINPGDGLSCDNWIALRHEPDPGPEPK